MYVAGNLGGGAGGRGAAGLATAVVPGGSSAERDVRAFLRANADLFLLDDPDRELEQTAEDVDEQGNRTLRFTQMHGGRVVWPAELVARLDRDGNLYVIESTQIPTPRAAARVPGITADEAVARVFRSVPLVARGTASNPELVVFGPLDEAPRLAWRFKVTVGLLNAWSFVVDAVKGQVLSRTPLVYDAAVKGSGADVTGANRVLDIWQDGGSYYLVDASKPMFDRTSAPPTKGRGVITIYDGNNKVVEDPAFSSGIVRSSSPTSGWLPDAVGSSWGLSATYDYFLATFKRDSLDGRGGSINSIVRYDRNLANAFWNGQTKTMVFGDFETKFVEVTGHELTHGVSDSVGNGGVLEYRFQSGALNESMSDIFGNMVKLHATGAQDWQIRLYANGVDKVIRDFKNPNNVVRGGVPYPKNMTEFQKLPIEEDQGGVHINSSINNHAFYLLAEGIPDALGLKDSEQIFYRALTQHLQKQSQFIDMRLAAVTAAEELFGKDSRQARKVKEAFDGVQIFDAPDSPPPAPIPPINAPDSTLFLSVEQLSGDVVLGRREAALNDPVQGVVMNTQVPLAGKRLAVSGDGSLVVFVTIDNDVGVMATDGSSLDFANVSGLIHSVAMSPDAKRIALVLKDAFSGQPKNQITLVDVATGTSTPVKLFSPTKDGNALDIIQYADSMAFLPDGNTVIYDAYAVIPLQNGGFFEGWSIYSMDLVKGQILSVIDLNDTLDIGNPNVGKTKRNLMTFELVDKKSRVATVMTADLESGAVKPIAQLTQSGVLGFPTFAGDDRAIVYSQVDLNTVTTISLQKQVLAEDGVTPVGNPTLWLADADFGTVYRRGSFQAQNSPPTVRITSPAAGQLYTAPATVKVDVSATDAETGVAKVGLFLGSTLLGEAANPPYSFTLTIQEAPTGVLQLVARALDTVGAQGDSAPLELRFTGGGGTGKKGLLVASVTGNVLQLRVTGVSNGDRVRLQGSEDLKNWSTVADLTATGTEAVYADPGWRTSTKKFFRSLLNP